MSGFQSKDCLPTCPAFLVVRVFLSFAVVLVGFSLAMGQTTETTLHNFMGGTDGADPVADLLYVPGTGIIYGTTEKGGGSTACTKGCGTVFSIHPDGSSYSVLYSFAGGGTDGANPEAGLVMDVSGNLWGTTYNGGTHNLGTVYELSPIGGGMYSESFVFSFTGKNGSHPLARLVLDSSGNVYGTTYAGGTKGDGAVFELAVSGAETVLHSFSGPDGSHPRAGVVFDSGGRLWGTTSLGGESKLGTVFVLSRSGSVWSETFLYSFTGANGANPYGAVTLDASGNAYGTTKFGGSTCPIAAAGCGVVYELEPSGGGYTGSVIYPFAGSTDGALPADALTWTVDESGFSYLYGTASEGGDTIAGCATKGCGTAFELCSIGSSCGSSSPWAEYTLFDFTGRTTGRTPEAGILNFTPSGGLDPLTHRGRELHGGCTIVCVTTLSSGGSSGNGTLDELP